MTRLPPPASTRPGLPGGPYLIVGIGRAGRAAAGAIADHAGPSQVRAWDASLELEARRSRSELAALGIEVQLGGDGLPLLEGSATVVKSPGVPPDAPLIAAARARGLEVLDELELGWRLTDVPVFAVTGTNGKSTSSELVVSALAAAGRRPVLAGNTKYGPPLSTAPTDGGCVVAEVSSYQAEGCLRFLPDASLFTNLTRDHMDRHGSMAVYGAAKRRLFVRGARAVSVAVINGDDAFGRRLAGAVQRRGGEVTTYGFGPTNTYRIHSVDSQLTGSSLAIDTPDGRLRVRTRLNGRHNAMNVAGALALARALGVPEDVGTEALATAAPLPGRFEPVSCDEPFDVFVDFAHSPDAVEKTLVTARTLASRRRARVIVVFGNVAQGERRTFREIGRAARAGADRLVLCASSWGGEPGLVALQAVLEGARAVYGGSLEIVLDRRQAIARGLEHAADGDIVLILGRGSETRMAHDRRDGIISFDDREVARELLGARPRSVRSEPDLSREPVMIGSA